MIREALSFIPKVLNLFFVSSYLCAFVLHFSRLIDPTQNWFLLAWFLRKLGYERILENLSLQLWQEAF